MAWCYVSAQDYAQHFATGKVLSMAYYQECGTPKPEPRCITKRRHDKLDAKAERACRKITRKRDLGKCRIPGCIDRAMHLHHIEYRSASSRRKWRTENCVWLCLDHHRLEHAHEIRISGNADQEIEVTGNIDALKFRL